MPDSAIPRSTLRRLNYVPSLGVFKCSKLTFQVAFVRLFVSQLRQRQLTAFSLPSILLWGHCLPANSLCPGPNRPAAMPIIVGWLGRRLVAQSQHMRNSPSPQVHTPMGTPSW